MKTPWLESPELTERRERGQIEGFLILQSDIPSLICYNTQQPVCQGKQWSYG